jgi:hypothetical protein
LAEVVVPSQVALVGGRAVWGVVVILWCARQQRGK